MSASSVLRRAIAGERVWQAHRTHFYQRATQYFTVGQIVRQVFTLNIELAALALITVVTPSLTIDAVALALGAAAVALLLRRFSNGKG